MSVVPEVADAIVDELNATSWSQALTAERIRIAEPRLEDLDDMRVMVRGVSEKPHPLSRSKTITKAKVEIAVMIRLPDTEHATFDPYVRLLEEIADHFHTTRLQAVPDIVVTGSVPEPPYDERSLTERKQFTGVVRLEATDYR